MGQSIRITRGFIVTLVTLFVISLKLNAEPYCLALRGNGEAQPAHWGALANLVEKMGLPQIQSGGSSASVSLMFLDSIAANPWVNSGNPEEKKSRAAFLLKSLHGITIFLGKAALGQLLQIQVTPTEGSNTLPIVVQALNSLGVEQSSRYFFLVKTLRNLQQGALLSQGEYKKINFYTEELNRALKTIGAFDAESDPSIFFRDGIVDFKKLGLGLGQIATFISGQKANVATQEAFNKFTLTCEPLHQKLTWAELTEQNPHCQELLNKNYQAFLNQKLSAGDNVALRPLGQHITSLPTTSVLVGSAYQQARLAYKSYHKNLDRGVAERFVLSNTSELKFGYWGPDQLLQTISRNLKSNHQNDEKSSRFMGLGSTTWLEVLRLSPAEPGLASFQPMKVNNQGAYSAGGWSDLHPVLVLKAAGCENIIYVTRKGGESLFGQGIAKRLLNLDRSWEKLSTKNPEALRRNKILNDIGEDNDQDSLWSRLYNVANPNSSFMKSVAVADAVLCTDWNQYDVKKELPQMVHESYHAPFILNSHAKSVRSTLLNSWARIVDESEGGTNGMPGWPGCH